MAITLTIDPDRPEKEIVKTASKIIVSGGLLVLPTSGLYGIGAGISQTTAVERVFQIKGRARSKPLLALISRRHMLSQLVEVVPPLASFLMDHMWPGGVTLVMAGLKHLPDGVLSDSGKVGVRLVRHPVAVALIDAVNGPITGTSANLSGADGCADPECLPPAIAAAVDGVLDAGPLAGGPGSSVVDVTGDVPIILRQGVVPSAKVMTLFDQYHRRHVDNTG